MSDVGQYLKSAFATLTPDEALRHPASVLLSVSQSAQSALQAIGINTVFDLAASRTFAAATRLLAIQNDPTAPEARLNAVAADEVDAPAGVPATELADRPIAILRGIGPAHSDTISAALDVTSMRDLALWPPYAAAKAVLALAYFPQNLPGFDAEAPADLLPKSGVYPTERVFYKKLVIDSVPPRADGAQPLEQAEPIDLATALSAPEGFGRLATGALLTFSQSWFSQGLALGQLLHSVTLAPGESTRIAIVDWSRRTRAAASEEISESELLSNAMTHSRAISEVTQATASEFQSGSSSVTSKSTTAQAGAGWGISIGPFGFGGSAGASTSNTEVMSASSSFGARDLAASYSQDINDRSQQNASSVRNRRASIVREVSQAEHEQISTRVITNYNHMHALSVQYFEVVQAFRTTALLERAERCLFVPVKLMDFSDPALVDRWRATLADAALTDRALRQLTVEYGVVEIIPQTPRIKPGNILINGLRGAVVDAAAAITPAAAPTGGTAPPGGETTTGTPPARRGPTTTDYTRAPIDTPAALVAVKGWNVDQLNRIGWTTGRITMQPGSDSVFISDDALVIGFSLRDGNATSFVTRTHDGREIAPALATGTAVAYAAPVPITELDSIAVQFMGTADVTTSLVLQLNLLGTVMPLDVPIILRSQSVAREVVKFGNARAARDLIDHLQANRLHYTQAIMRSMDAAAVAALLARFTYRGLPLGMLVDSQPFAVMANFLVFKLNVATSGDAEDERWAEEQASWQTWLARRGLDRPAPKSEVIPLPSGGVFAEAVLGRYNSAEKIDLARFWNWQDSPIPIAAPEIAAVQAGSRAQPEDLKPGQLSQPILNIQAPTALPEAAGVGAIIAAIQQGNMFRDMSGLAQAAALAQAALQATARGATAVGEQAGQNMKTVVDAQTERMRIAAQLAAQMMGMPAFGGSGGGGALPAGRGTVSERGGELNAADAIDAQRAVNGGSAGAGAFDGSSSDGETASPSLRKQLLLAQADPTQAAARVADALLMDSESGDGGGGGLVQAKPGTKKGQRQIGKSKRQPATAKIPTSRELRITLAAPPRADDLLGRERGWCWFLLKGDSDSDPIGGDWRRLSPPTGEFAGQTDLKFKTSSSDFRLDVKWFPFYVENVSERDREEAALKARYGGGIGISHNADAIGIFVSVLASIDKKRVLVPMGQEFDAVVKQVYGINPYMVISRGAPRPVRNPLNDQIIANQYDDVTYYDGIELVPDII